MKTLTLTGEVTLTLVTETCCVCGVAHAFPQAMRDAARKDSKLGWYCPNGHHLGWPVSEADRLRKKLDEKQALLDRQKIRLSQAQADADYQRRQRETAERSLSATRGHLTRVKRRVANGVCPCCHRTFVKLGRHMKTQHPGFAQAEGDDA